MYKKIIAISLIISMNLIFIPIGSIQNAEANIELDLDSTYELQKRVILDENNLSEEELAELKAEKLQTQQLNSEIRDGQSNLEKGAFKDNQQEKLSYVPGEVLVKFKSQEINLEQSSGRIKATEFAVSKNLNKKEDIRKSNISVLKTKGNESVEEMIDRLKSDPNVEYVEPNYKRYLMVINTNDTYKDELWGLDNTGQTVNSVAGTVDADIDAPEAWAISEGDENEVIVAIIDSGVAYNHPDLIDNMWDGSNCLDENGDFLGACNHGYDYEDGDKIPLPTTSSHGTHIAGTIGAMKNNNKSSAV